ncbi:MAG: type II secretion system protein [Limnospira sp. PMC 1291.21]|uniref:Type II secretion system protein n=1 Tax=Limnospira fusiformis PMC 851.14 TaxID=2219512 RepID=A0ABU9EK63_LIMFS|nr:MULTISPECIES: GspH/FimT family pseudopilin [unclassified Limnospira]MDT9176433.1 type II secretion system protein [Limnospira sp. PMC 1238.20]MDT9186461.1 type II secretion system protein [Limnospira sp. PMC 894.15]MDT9191795.1 type II secretion system protein [Limnospira sp. PMC 1245.20]MDT9202056.1 type II secretion system protein [Limnospira sp. PMC 1243.20]MDT9207194.1 type II secretion system protein [Limnospira sp. PMC 1252.20]
MENTLIKHLLLVQKQAINLVAEKPVSSDSPGAKSRKSPTESGFSLLEVLGVMVIISILGGIAVPTWLGFANNQKLQTSIRRLNWAIHSAKSEAILSSTSWQASIREYGGRVQVAVHPAKTPPGQLPEGSWTNLEPGIEIDNRERNTRNKYETTLRRVDPDTNQVRNAGTVYRVLFNYQGCPVYNPSNFCTQTSLAAKGRIAIHHPEVPGQKRCIIISTLIGATRIGQQQQRPDQNGYYCH